MLVTLKEVLTHAQKEHYGVGLFNTVNFEMAKGVISAAEEAKAPVIIGTAEVLLPSAGLRDLGPLLYAMAKNASVPVVLHFDHGLTEGCIKEAIHQGFTSVMYDCSTQDFEHNCKAVADITAYAHERGVTVEGELGHVGDVGPDAACEEDPESLYTQPDKARLFVEQTGVDALAVAIGTAHGAYRSAPKLDFDRLSVIAKEVSVPLVLHGGSGLSPEDFRQAIARGIAKVNIYTDINQAALRGVYDNYRPGLGIVELMPEAIQSVKAAALEKMELFGCCGRA